VCGSTPTDAAKVIRLRLNFAIEAEAESSELSINMIATNRQPKKKGPTLRRVAFF
jgi:hypothetical protein